MLGKLMKYDFKSMFKVFIPLWLALLAVSVINRFTAGINHNGMNSTVPAVVFLIIYACLIVAVMVLAVALIIMRFYNGLLKDEGYLMFTLPVKPWQLVTSKCLTATVISILSLIAGMLSVLFIAADGDFFRTIAEGWRRFLPYWTSDMGVTVALVVLLMIFSVIKSVTQVYAALAVGHLANNHRIGWSVAAYIAISAVLSTVFMSCADLFGRISPHWYFNFDQCSSVGQFNLLLLGLLVVTLVQVVLFFVATERILSKKLNLE